MSAANVALMVCEPYASGDDVDVLNVATPLLFKMPVPSVVPVVSAKVMLSPAAAAGKPEAVSSTLEP